MLKKTALILLVLVLTLLGGACGGGDVAAPDGEVEEASAPEATPTEQEPEASPLDDLPQAGMNEELTIGDTIVVVTGGRLLESIRVNIGFGDSEMKPEDPDLIFWELHITVTNLGDEDADLEGGEEAGSIFSLLGGDGKGYGSFGKLSEPILEAGSTRNISKTFVIHRDAIDGAKLIVVDNFSDTTGVVLLEK
jgi:hypothetical protein